MKVDDITNYIPQVGDIYLVKGTSWLARAIQFWMRVYLKRTGTTTDFIPNHAATVIDVWGVAMVAEANAKGVEARYTADEYIKKNKIVVMRVNQEVDADWSKYASQYFAIPHRYDVLNFIYQMLMILTGKWYGPTGHKAERRIYCSEYVAILLDKCYDLYDTTYDKNPIDIYFTKGLQVITRNF